MQVIKNNTLFILRKSALGKDSFTGNIEIIIDAVQTDTVFQLTNITANLKRYASRINPLNQSSANNTLKVFNIYLKTLASYKIISIESELLTRRKQNARLTKSIPEQILTKIADKIYVKVCYDKVISSLAIDIIQAFSWLKNRAKIIACRQKYKLNGSLTRFRHLAPGITKCEWLTSRDRKVRRSHDVLEGKGSWLDPDKYKHLSIDLDYKALPIIGGPA